MRFVTTAFAAAIVWVLMSVPAGAQPSFDLLFKSAQVTLNENVVKVDDWAGWASLSLGIVLTIGALGIVIAGLQATSFKWKGVATAVVGGLVSGATAFNAATVPADFKTLNELVATGTGLINATKDWLDTGRQAATDPDRQFALDEIQKRLTALAALTLRGGGSQDPVRRTHWFRLDGVAVLHAAELMPNCGCKRPLPQRMYGDVFGCGTASGSSLSDAHDRAALEAAKHIASQLQNNLRGQGAKWTDQQLVDYIKQVASEFDSCPVGGAKTTLTVLLRLPQTLGHAQAITAFSSRSSPAQLTVSKIEVNQDGSARDTGWTFDVFVDGKLASRIPARDYSDRPASRSVPMTLQAPVDLAKGSYWLVEIKGKRTNSAETVMGAAAVGAGRPTQVAVANPVPEDGSFVFTVSVAKK